MRKIESHTCALPGGQWDGKKRERDGEGDVGKEEYLIFHIYIPDCQLIQNNEVPLI